MAVKNTQDWAQALAGETNTDNEPMPVRIVDRNGEPYLDKDGNPAVILILGEYSDAVKRFDRQQTNKNIRNRGQTIDADDAQSIAAARCAAGTAGWNIVIGGQEVPFNRENATTLYAAAEWICDQAFRGMRVRSDFFAKR